MKMPIDAAQLQGTNSATHAWVDLGYRAKKKHFGLASTYHTYHIPAPGDKHADIVPNQKVIFLLVIPICRLENYPKERVAKKGEGLEPVQGFPSSGNNVTILGKMTCGKPW